ncbi:MAG: hypothetical protein QM820_03475 [Minicystis sp.]
MTSRKPRTIKVGAVVYFWRVAHRHGADRPIDGQRCTEVFTAFRERHPRRPVRILFRETEEHGPGFPRQSGVIVDYQEPARYINLNRPRLARLLIELAVAAGWEPDRARGEFILPDGYQLLRENRLLLDAALAADPGEGEWRTSQP